MSTWVPLITLPGTISGTIWGAPAFLYLGPSFSFGSLAYPAVAPVSSSYAQSSGSLALSTSSTIPSSLTPSTSSIPLLTTYLFSGSSLAFQFNAFFNNVFFSSVALPINIVSFPAMSLVGLLAWIGNIIGLLWFPGITLIIGLLGGPLAYVSIQEFIFIIGAASILVSTGDLLSALGSSFIVPTLGLSLSSIPPLSLSLIHI